MFCSNCGNQIDSDSKVCSHCGVSVVSNSNPIQVNNNGNVNSAYVNNSNVNNGDIPTFSPAHSIFLIVFCILCCGGIIGVVFAILSLVEGNKVNDYVKNGNIEEAKIAKNKSTKWIKATYITCAVVAAVTLVLWIIYFFFLAAGTAIDISSLI